MMVSDIQFLDINGIKTNRIQSILRKGIEMNGMRFFVVCVLALVMPAISSGEIMTATDRVEMEDKAGDVRDNGDNPGKDVVKVILDTDGKNLTISVQLAEEAKVYLDGHQAGDVVEVIIDADNNTETGGKPFFYEGSGGFDFEIEVGACIEYEGGGMACSGALTGSKATNFFSTYALSKYTEESNTERISEPFEWKSRGKDIKGNTVEVTLGYDLMNLKSGQQLRIAVKENDDSTFKKEYLPEVLLTIK